VEWQSIQSNRQQTTLLDFSFALNHFIISQFAHTYFPFKKLASGTRVPNHGMGGRVNYQEDIYQQGPPSQPTK
jgi:hypothetical protein